MMWLTQAKASREACAMCACRAAALMNFAEACEKGREGSLRGATYSSRRLNMSSAPSAEVGRLLRPRPHAKRSWLQQPPLGAV